MPFAENAIVEDEKVVDYLLNMNHPEGRSKAMFFSRFGCVIETKEKFKAMLLKHAQTQPVIKEEVTRFGHKFVIDGPAISFGTKKYYVRSVWMIYPDSNIPKLITAYPYD